MTAQIIDFAQKKREKRAREFLETDVTSLSPEEIKSLQISLRNIIITEAGENNIYPGDGYTTVMINGMGYHIPDIDLEDNDDE